MAQATQRTWERPQEIRILKFEFRLQENPRKIDDSASCGTHLELARLTRGGGRL